MSESAPTEPAAGQVNVSALLDQAATKSAVAWVDVPDDRAYAVWHVWTDGAFLVVSGPGEQHLPWLPETVEVLLRSKDTGGRLLRISASAEVISPEDSRWSACADALKGERLNATDDVVARWAAECTVHRLTPFGAPGETYLAPREEPARAAPAPSAATTRVRRPWHWRGRPQRRRRLRR